MIKKIWSLGAPKNYKIEVMLYIVDYTIIYRLCIITNLSFDTEKHRVGQENLQSGWQPGGWGLRGVRFQP